VQHSATQKADLTKYFTQFGQSQEGMAQFLQRNDTHLSAFLYREIDYAEPFVSTKISADPSIPADISLSGPIVDTVNAPESPSASESPMTSHVNPLRWFRT
jgi:hypothetical protein